MKRYFIPWFVTCLAMGCQQDTKLPVTNLGELPGLRGSHDSELRAELARIEAEQGTPRQLDKSVGLATPSTCGAADPRLTEIMSSKQADFLVRRITSKCPISRVPFGPERRAQALEIRRAFGEQRHQMARLLSGEDFHFVLSHQEGLLANLSFLDYATAYFYLEALEVAHLYETEQLNEAILPLAQMFTTVTRLDEKRHVASRLAGGRLRGVALTLVETLGQHPAADESFQRRLERLVCGHLQRWPHDAEMWVGDRALGMHAYEVIRIGALASLLTERELEQLAAQRRLATFMASVENNVDHDELTYLKLMRELIASCELPYHARTSSIESFENQLEDLQDSPREPVFAARFLLDEVGHAMRLLAEDRARAEAMSVALATALAEPPKFGTNPLTGQPYEIEVKPQQVVVWPLGKGDEPIILPRTVTKPVRPKSRASLSG